MLEHDIRRVCAERRIRIERLGQLYVLIGPGVDVRTTSLALIRVEDLTPVYGTRRRQTETVQER